MARWKVKVIETRSYHVNYYVEATTREDAYFKAAIGDTINETDLALRCVLNREIESVQNG